MTEEQLYERVPLSPPYVANVHACGQKVLAVGIHEDATAHLYINGDPVDSAPGNAVGKVEFNNIPPLERGMELTARQVLDDNESAMSNERVVHELYDDLPKPVIPYDVWECGEKVTAQAQVPGTKMRLYLRDNIIAEDFTTDRWRNDKWPMLYEPGLPEGEPVSVDMVYCPGTDDEEISPLSEASITKEAPSTTEVGSVTAYREANRLRIEDTYVGSTDMYYKNSDHIFNIRAKFADFYHHNMSDWTVGEDDEFIVATELCPGTAGRGTIAETTSTTHTLSLIDMVTIKDPLCPEADVLRVKTPLATGHIVVFVNDNMVQAQPVSGNPTIIDVSDLDLEQGDVIGVRQYLPYDGGMHESEMSTVEIDEDSDHDLKVTSHTTVEDQISGDEHHVFIRDGDDMSAGPKFEYTCCTSCECDGCVDMGYQCRDPDYDYPHVRQLELRLWTELSPGQEWDTSVTLYEETRGHFTGRWDWTTSSEVPPAGVYNVDVLDSPCEGSGDEASETDSFIVTIGEGDTDSDDPPTRIELSAVQEGGAYIGFVSDTSSDTAYPVDSASAIDLKVTGRDPWSGVKKVEIFGVGDFDVSPEELNAENETPVPSKLTMESVQAKLDPGDTVELQARVYDWSDNLLETSVLRLDGMEIEHEKPVITTIDPLQPETDGEITIEGYHLLPEVDGMYTETRVYFDHDDFQDPIPVTIGNFYDGSSNSALTDVPIPDQFDGKEGESAVVWVETTIAADEKESTPFEFTFQNGACTEGIQRKTLELAGEYLHTFWAPISNPCTTQPTYVTHVTNPTNAYGSINNDCDATVYLRDYDTLTDYGFAGPVGPGETWAGAYIPIQTLDSNKVWIVNVDGLSCDSWGIPDQLYLDFHWESVN